MGKEKKFNGWGIHIIESFFSPVRYFSKAISERVLPSFDNLDEESNEKYEQLVAYGRDSEWAWEESVSEYVWMSDIRQSITNLSAVGLRHLYEQQFCYLVSRLLGEKQREADYKKDEKLLIKLGEINVVDFRSWHKLKELEYVCNAVKHAEGRSSKELEKVRPDLFENPLLLELPVVNFSGKRLPVQQPLAGENIFLQKNDIESYAVAIEDFWSEFIEVLKEYGRNETSNF